MFIKYGSASCNSFLLLVERHDRRYRRNTNTKHFEKADHMRVVLALALLAAFAYVAASKRVKFDKVPGIVRNKQASSFFKRHTKAQIKQRNQDVEVESDAYPQCTTDALNLRNGPSTGNGVIRTLPRGTTVNVYSVNNGWAQVDGGYVSSQFLSNCGNAVRQCTTTALNLRSEPSTNARVIRTLGTGTAVTVLSSSNGWATTSEGFLSTQYLTNCGGAAPVSGGSPCGQSYVNGSPGGEKYCVRIDGENVVTSTAAVFNVMKNAAASAGITLRVNSGFRTQSEQQYFYNCYIYKNCNSGNLAAKPGWSNHQNGIALDINSPSNVYNWLVRNASRYGFVRTVPSEVWHWEYRPGSRCNAFVSYSCN